MVFLSRFISWVRLKDVQSNHHEIFKEINTHGTTALITLCRWWSIRPKSFLWNKNSFYSSSITLFKIWKILNFVCCVYYIQEIYCEQFQFLLDYLLNKDVNIVHSMLKKCSTDPIYKFTCEFNHEPTYSPVPYCRRREELENRVGLVKFIQKRGKGRGGTLK